MLTCIPQSICSWNFRALAEDRQVALVNFNWMSEQGTIEFGGREYAVRKHGPMSGRWTLEDGGTVYAEAQKRSALFREFAIRSAGGEFTAKARNPFGRSYDLLSGGTPVGAIEPMHLFTRRSTIECDSVIRELDQLFAFWLAVLTWKRAARRNAAASSS